MQDWFYFQFGEKKPFEYQIKGDKIALSIPYPVNLKKKGDILIYQLVQDDNRALKTPIVKGPTRKIDYDSATVFHDPVRNVFMSKIYGYCGFINNRLVVIPPLIINETHSIARLYINPEQSHLLPGIDDIFAIIEAKKIFPSVDKFQLERNLKAAVESNQRYVLIARGRAMEEAHPAYVICEIDLSKSVGKIKEDGRIDFKDRDAIKEVFVGDTIGKYVEANPGKEGFNIYGQKVNIIKNVKGPAMGKNLALSESEKNTVISKVNGYLEIKDHVLDVIETLVIKGDVDYDIGNIEFSGSVEIMGKITSGFSVTSFGNLTVYGVVEGANLFSSHDMNLHSGVISAEGCKIECMGSFKARYIQNANLHVKEDIHVEDFIYHSNIICNGKIKVEGKSGVILGGKIIAKKEIECQQAGNKGGVATELLVGVDQDLDEKLKVKKQELNNLIERRDYIESQLKKIVSPVFFRNPESYLSGQPEAAQKTILKIYEQLKKMEEWVQSHTEELEDLEKKGVQVETEPKITIHKTKYPGVKTIVYSGGKRISDMQL